MLDRMNRGFVAAIGALLLQLASAPLSAAVGVSDEDGANAIKATLLADVSGITPGSEFTLGIHLKIAPHWHTYWINPGEFGEPVQINLRGPAGFEFGPVQWPLPKTIHANGAVTYGYEDEVMLLVPVKVSPLPNLLSEAPIEADVSWLVCHESCIPGEAKLSIRLPFTGKKMPANTAQFEQWLQRLPLTSDRAAEVLRSVKQDDQTITINWNNPPRKVEWYPAATQAVAIETVAVDHAGAQTRVQFDPTVYEAAGVPGGKVDSLMVYEDAEGQRRGVPIPFTIKVSK